MKYSSRLFTLFIFLYTINSIAAEPIQNKLSICKASNHVCYNNQPISTIRQERAVWLKKKQQLFVELGTILDLQKIKNIINTHNKEKSLDEINITKIAQYLNFESVNIHLNKLPINLRNQLIKIEYVAVNNSVIFTFEKNNKTAKKENIKILVRTLTPFEMADKKSLNKKASNATFRVGLIDSGISSKHEQLKAINISQYNPKDNTFIEKDTGLGHGTGIISLFNREINKLETTKSVVEVEYLSCNGLEDGQYDYLNILRCFDWFFLEDNVNILLNPWLVNSPGCVEQLNYPIQMIWSSGTIPIFAAGNRGKNLVKSYSPANLSPFGKSLPLLSVGSLSKQITRLPSSSFGASSCDTNRPHTQIVALGDSLEVAAPFTEQSYQSVSGTSYAIVFIGKAVAHLKMKYPNRSNTDIVMAIFESAEDLGRKGLDFEYGHGRVNLSGAISILEQPKAAF